MQKVVVNTNVLVSAMWSKSGNSEKIVSMIFDGELIPCYDHRIIDEYKTVLSRQKFKFSVNDVKTLIDYIKDVGLSVIASRSNISMPDESDRKFYDMAVACGAILITGNLKHFPPNKSFIITPAEFLKIVEEKS